MPNPSIKVSFKKRYILDKDGKRHSYKWVLYIDDKPDSRYAIWKSATPWPNGNPDPYYVTNCNFHYVCESQNIYEAKQYIIKNLYANTKSKLP